MNVKAVIAALALVAGLAGTGIAGAQVATAQVVPPNGNVINPNGPRLRGDGGSDRNIRAVERRLERLIDQLQRDQHDYNGLRVKAIGEMQEARNDLAQAIRYDSSRGR